jgi:cytochrome P450
MAEQDPYLDDPDAEGQAEPEPPPPVPTGLELTPLDTIFRGSPYPVVAEMREREPVHHDTEFNRYFLSRHDDIRAVLLDDTLWTDPRKASPGTYAHRRAGLDAGEPALPLLDDPAHARLRRIVSGVLNQDSVDAFRPRIDAIVRRFLDELEMSEFEIEVIGRYAALVASVAIAEFVGVDPKRHRPLKRWADAALSASGNPFRSEDEAIAGATGQHQIGALVRESIAARRSAPASDLISALLAVRDEGQALDEREIVEVCTLLLISGCVTLTDLIGNGIRAMLQNTRQMTRLREHPDLVENAVEEILRFDSPVVATTRIASRDMLIGECPIGKGATISLSLAAANRDESIYPQADFFDIHRSDTHHHAFGAGRHFCLGAPFARAVTQAAIVGLVVQFPQLELNKRGWEFAAVPGYRRMKYFWIQT